jgi:HlyD family secretion protein
VEARIVVDQQPDALKIPASALFRTADGWALFVVEDNIARQRAVEIGLQNGIEAEIVASESGGKPPLQPGDLVVVHPSDRLTDGARVMSR